MTDSLLSLAFSVYSAKGVYALLLGSGISRSAGVPTGWDVTQDLIRRAARLYGEDGSNAEEWYTAKYDKDPDYSELLEQLAKSPAERTKLLQAYFEPTEQERSEGQKLPTVAHRAIATLVAKGYIRVIITTNFDRLLEHALGDVGVQPSVIASADSEKGVLPLAHARCTVIKINGDYLDPRFKNTRDELSSYEPALERLLDRVFDEYGLIVCGWSAEWDTGLRTAIERCPTRRFTTYWAAHGKCSEKALRVIDNRQGVILSIANADACFSELEDRVDALETFSANDPLSAPIAVARAKRYLSDPQYAILLHDLLTNETVTVLERTNLLNFPTNNENPSSATLLPRLKRLDSILDVLLQLFACSTYWANNGSQEDLVLRCFRRIVEANTFEGGNTVWIGLRRYPALLMFYAIGIAAVANGKYAFLKRLFEVKIFDPLEERASADWKALTRLLCT